MSVSLSGFGWLKGENEERVLQNPAHRICTGLLATE